MCTEFRRKQTPYILEKKLRKKKKETTTQGLKNAKKQEERRRNETKEAEREREEGKERSAGPAFRYIYHRRCRHFTTGNTLTSLVDD